MTPTLIGVLGIVVFLALLFTGLPVAVCMLIPGVIGISMILTPAAALNIIKADIFNNLSSYTMSVVPLFALMGYLANYSGIGGKLFSTANSFIGHHRGGLAMATDVACAVFGAICGSVPATIGAMGSISYPEMKRYGYKNELAGGIIAAGSSLAILIPPSVNLVIYGVATETSVGRLFAGGIGPGVVRCLFYAIAIGIWAKLRPDIAGKAPKASWGERWQTIKAGGVIEIAIVFILSIGGLFIGWFTATEAGAVGAMGILVIGVLERRITFRNLVDALFDTAKLSAMVFILVATAMIFGRLFTLSRIPTALGVFVSSVNAPHWVIMFLILLIYFVAGCFIDTFSMILITIPVFAPLVTDVLGYDPVWFCVMCIVILSMGSLTPPVGMNVFMTRGIIKDGPALGELFKGVLPFLACQVVLAVLMVFIPGISTWLPDLMYG